MSPALLRKRSDDCKTPVTSRVQEDGRGGTGKKEGSLKGSPGDGPVGRLGEKNRRSGYRLNENVARMPSSVISVVTLVPGTGPITGEMKGPEISSERAR